MEKNIKNFLLNRSKYSMRNVNATEGKRLFGRKKLLLLKAIFIENIAI